jgi:putative transposase
MMSTYTQILYQIVFSTKNRESTLTKNNRDELFQFMTGILKSKKCHLYQIGGVENHIHIITHLHPSIALSELVKDLKLGSTSMIKRNCLFKNFNGWQDGFGAFTYGIKSKERLIHYVINQEEHHQKKDFISEYKELLEEFEIKFDEKYLI